MIATEIAIWNAFKRLNLSLLTAVHYNVHVGTVAGDDVDQDPADRKLAATLLAKRIDVIARLATETWIIEVKENATPRAIGQLLTYVPGARARFPDFPRLRPMILSNRIDADAQTVCASLEILCIVPPFRQLATL